MIISDFTIEHMNDATEITLKPKDYTRVYIFNYIKELMGKECELVPKKKPEYKTSPCVVTAIGNSASLATVVPNTIQNLIYTPNPCREIIMNNEVNMTPHSELAELRGSLNVGGSHGLNGTLKLLDETATLTINLPGVSSDKLEIRKIDNLLRIRVLPTQEEIDRLMTTVYGIASAQPREVVLIMTAEETVTDVTLDLGVLEISIDRGREIEDFEVNAIH